MTARVVLHIGAPKTGTSFVQSVLSHHRDLLRDRGILWPGETWGDQVRAVEDLRDASKGTTPTATRWDLLVKQIDDFDGDMAVVSMEWLCMADRRMAARAVRSFARYDLTIVLTLRDLARAIPAQWQESTQNGFSWTYHDFLEGLTSTWPRRTRAGAHFWANQDWARMVATWGSAGDRRPLVVVTVPPRGTPPSLLWERFCAAAGIEPIGFVLEGWPNESLGAASAEVMRRLSAMRRGEGGRSRKHRAALKHALAKNVLAGHRQSEPSLILDPARRTWVERTTRRQLDKLREADIRVVGNLDELWPVLDRPSSTRVTDPALLGDEALLDAALYGLLEITRPGRRSSRLDGS